LVFDSELATGALDESALHVPAVRRATIVKRVRARPVRVVQQILYELGQLSFERNVAGALLAARAALPSAAAVPPRLLVRVDEFPHFRAWDEPARFGTDAFERFHEIMAGAGVPYLLAVLPYVSREPLSPEALGERALDEEEVALLKRLAGENVTLALHGRSHRTRHASPRRRSELCGLTPAETEQLVERALAELEPHGVRPKVFVPPYNRFDSGQLRVLADRFAVVCGGPESIGSLGFQRSPQWRGETVYLPSYVPFYGRAADVLPAAERAIARLIGMWIPVVLHWGWEARDGWRDLELLARRIAGCAARWEDFLDAVTRSRGGACETKR
jgi:peptidoglycan/xylan/chitin deacetylase (PgdA/CDA1 family)